MIKESQVNISGGPMEQIAQSVTRIQLSERATDIFNTKRIGVALGPGFPIGLVDLGMLIAFDQLKLPVHMISGTSIGALIGALYAAGTSADEISDHIIKLLENDELQKLIYKDTRSPRFGLSNANKLIDELIRLVGIDPEFHELKMPLFIISADKISQKSVVIRHGKVFEALKASLAMPIAMTKHQMGKMKLADGAIFSPLNTEVLYAEGAEFVVGIQAKPLKSTVNRVLPLKSRMEPYLFRILGWKTGPEILFTKPECDILLRPRVPKEIYIDKSRVEDIIHLGVKITYDAIQEIERGKIPKKMSEPENNKTLVENTVDANFKMEIDVSKIESLLVEYKNKTAKMSDGELMEEFPRFACLFRGLLDKFMTRYPKPEDANNIIKEKIKNLSKLVEQSPFMKRCLEKPLGYAGDYQMMNYIYDDNIFNAPTNMGKLLNYFIFSEPSAIAVKNRAKVVQGFIQYKLLEKLHLSVASIACGPAREVATMHQYIPSELRNTKILWTLMDQDANSLSYARENIPNHPNIEIKFIEAGIIQLLKKKLVLDQQDIIYSLGLFDYLNDKIAIKLINSLFNFLNPGGTLLIGNFHPRNSLRVFIEAALDWFLIHRTEEDMISLAENGAPKGRHYVMSEPGGMNLILVSLKPVN